MREVLITPEVKRIMAANPYTFKAPGGESQADVEGRAIRFLNNIAAPTARSDPQMRPVSSLSLSNRFLFLSFGPRTHDTGTIPSSGAHFHARLCHQIQPPSCGRCPSFHYVQSTHQQHLPHRVWTPRRRRMAPASYECHRMNAFPIMRSSTELPWENRLDNSSPN